MTLSVGNLTAGTDVASNYELDINSNASRPGSATAGAITASVMENFTVSAGNYSGIRVVGATTTNATGVSTVSITAGTGGNVLTGGVTATSAIALTSVTVSAGDASTVNTGALEFGSTTTIDTVSITGGTGASLTTGTLTAGTITSLTITEGAAGSGGTIGNIASSVTGGSITSGTSDELAVTLTKSSGTFGASTTPINLYGSGALLVNLIGATAVISGSSMGGGFKVDAASSGGLTGALTVTGGASADTVLGGAGSDTFTLGEGADKFNGGSGSLDHASFAGRALPISLTLNTSSDATYSVNGGSGIGQIVNVERVTGTSFDDTITGDLAPNYLSGGSGNDALDGAAGADTINGGLGNDTITGGGDADSLLGGGGNDIFVFNAGSQAAAVTLNSGATAITAAHTFVSGTSYFNTAAADVIASGFEAGDVLRFTTVHAMTLGTAGVTADNKVSYFAGIYDATTSKFTYDTSVTSLISGYGTLALYDADSTSGVSYYAVVIVGYLEAGTTDAFSTTGVTGLVATA